MTEPFRFQMYKRIYNQRQEMLRDAERLAAELRIPEELRGKFGLTPSHSSYPGPIAHDVLREMERAGREVKPLSDLVDDLRGSVKDFYGDEYDAVPIASGEAALWVAFDVLMSPSIMGRGDVYRSRYIAPFERHLTHQAGFGRIFPPKYKYVGADRYVTAGELGVEGKRLSNLDTILVPLAGARYEAHGIKYYPTPLLSTVDPDESAKRFAEVAERHASMLAGFASLGYDTPGYGYGAKATNGAPKLQTMVSALARKYDVPYVIDDAWGAPIVGNDLRKAGSTLMLYSGDKVLRGPLSGLIIGKDEAIVPIRRAMGTHSHRSGNPSAYAKAAFSAFDPGREAIAALSYTIKKLASDPGRYTRAVDELHTVVAEEIRGSIFNDYGQDVLVTKTYNNLAVEVNYDRTWSSGKTGIPIFTEEDSFASVLPIESIMTTVGVLPTIAYEGNILISPGHGTIDEDGALIRDRARLGVKALFGAFEIVSRYARKG
jgi:hypothetical protein